LLANTALGFNYDLSESLACLF